MADAARPAAEDAAADGDPDNDRLISLSDGIFAFAMTLMVLQFDMPTPEKVAAGSLRREVLDQWPSLLSYALSFFVIANYWIVHHGMFRMIRSHDMGLVWLNILFLFSISFLPFPTDVMGEYASNSFAVLFYAIAMSVTSLLSTAIWLYVSRRPRLLAGSVTPALARYHLLRGIGTTAIFLISAGLAEVSIIAARLFWLSLLVYHRALVRMFRGAV
jgi:uncharacterized membrane protein